MQAGEESQRAAGLLDPAVLGRPVGFRASALRVGLLVSSSGRFAVCLRRQVGRRQSSTLLRLCVRPRGRMRRKEKGIELVNGRPILYKSNFDFGRTIGPSPLAQPSARSDFIQNSTDWNDR